MFDLSQFEYVVIDTECTGLHWWKDKMFGFSIYLPGVGPRYSDIREQPQALRWLRDEMSRVRKVVNHHIKFDMHMLREAGVIIPRDKIECTMINAALIDEHLFTYDLDSLAQQYCGVGKNKDIYGKLAALFGGEAKASVQMKNLHRAPASLVAEYANPDVEAANALYLFQREEIKNQELGQVQALEMRLLPVLCEMERVGVPVDIKRAERSVDEVSDIINRTQKELNNAAGFYINANPSQTIHKLFAPKWVPAPQQVEGQKPRGHWVLIDGTIAGSTEAGKASLDADTMRRMKHPAAGMILKLRKLLKTRDTFIRGHILGHHDKGIIHAHFNQTKSDNDAGTGTGRLSVVDPALQQIPARDTDIASIVRALFIPPEGRDWVCHDWAQMDFRVFAHYTKSPPVMELYSKNPDADFHQIISDLTGIRRKPRYAGDANAKQINLGMVFGMGAGKLAAEMGLPYEVVWDERRNREWLKPGPETEEVLDRYYSAVPGVRKFLNEASSVAKERGFVRTILGRRIRFPRGQFTHKAGGLVFQGTAADALKVKLIEVDDFLRSQNGSGNHLMLNVHDEFDSGITTGDDATATEITRIVEKFDGEGTPIKFRVPIRSGMGRGRDWWQASKE
jgi:DNA polymerase I-like protein with 3'-5' exonuclease and polymerase domains